MKAISLFLLLMIIAGCKDDDISAGCINESKITDGLCPGNIDYVCGCDSKTYGNPCQAEVAGVTSYTAGKCK